MWIVLLYDITEAEENVIFSRKIRTPARCAFYTALVIVHDVSVDDDTSWILLSVCCAVCVALACIDFVLRVIVV